MPNTGEVINMNANQPQGAAPSLRGAAFIAGIAYLIAIFATPYAWINPLIDVGDSAATFSNLVAEEFLFRLAIACWLLVIVADTVVAWALFHFFAYTNKGLSLLALCLRLIFAPIMALAVFQWLGALQFIATGNGLTGEALQSAQDQSMRYLVGYEYAVNIAFMLFGLHVGVIGYLALRSKHVPWILGVFLMIACVGYQIDAYASIMSESYAADPKWFLVTIAVPAFFSEFGLTLWLLFKGAWLKEEGRA